MIYFGIPLRSQKTAKDWDTVVRVFNRTLRSVYRQTDPDFRVFVACHEIPKLEQDYDERVQFLISDQPVPQNQHEMMLDKGWKVSMIAHEVRSLGGGYLMIVDADDLVSNRIAAYAHAHPHENGFLSRYGYVYNDGFPYMKKILAPHRICGSCSIVYYGVEDLPEKMPENLWDDTHKDHWVVRKSHRIIPDYLAAHGKPLAPLPFPTTVYVRNTGDNHSMLSGGDLNAKRKIEIVLGRKIKLDGDVGFAFGFRD